MAKHDLVSELNKMWDEAEEALLKRFDSRGEICFRIPGHGHTYTLRFDCEGLHTYQGGYRTSQQHIREAALDAFDDLIKLLDTKDKNEEAKWRSLDAKMKSVLAKLSEGNALSLPDPPQLLLSAGDVGPKTKATDEELADLAMKAYPGFGYNDADEEIRGKYLLIVQAVAGRVREER